MTVTELASGGNGATPSCKARGCQYKATLSMQCRLKQNFENLFLFNGLLNGNGGNRLDTVLETLGGSVKTFL